MGQVYDIKKFGNGGRKMNDAAIRYQQPSRTIVHAKLEMTEPGDHDEQEADAAANDIVSGGKIRRQISNGGGSGISVSPQMESRIAQLQGGGHAMPEGLRHMMENGFGRDFSQVRLHTDSQAAEMSSSISARAFTHGNDIYFNRGQFSPNTAEGQHLVAHELTHVVQGGGKVGRKEAKGMKDVTDLLSKYVDEVKDELSRKYSQKVSEYNNCNDDSHRLSGCFEYGLSIGAASAGVGATAGSAAGGIGALPGAGLGFLGGFVGGCTYGALTGGSSFTDEEISSCRDTKQKMDNLDGDADKLKAKIFNLFYHGVAWGLLNTEDVYISLYASPWYYKQQIKDILSKETEDFHF